MPANLICPAFASGIVTLPISAHPISKVPSMNPSALLKGLGQ